MLELGVTNTQSMNDCGRHFNETCAPLTAIEAQTHFGAWAIVSSPLVLGFDLTDSAQLALHWPTISNRDAIAVNQDYAGFSGSLFARSSELTTFPACDWTVTVTCAWPSRMHWYKPLSGRDARGSTVALLLMNNADDVSPLSVEWAAVPGLGSPESCAVYDVWERRSVGRHSKRFAAKDVESRGSVFVTLSECV